MKRVVWSVALIGFAMLAGGITYAGQATPGMADMMTPLEYQESGVWRLSETERAALDRWLVRYSVELIQVAKEQGAGASRPSARGRSSVTTYEVELAHNDELFIINGEKYSAKTYCFGWMKGDRVVFLEGSALGVCVSAELFNTRTQSKCDVWCE